jgi:endonuclease YncB( thermonuclease family)
MTRYGLILGLVFQLLTLAHAAPPVTHEGQVKRIIDGDSLHFLNEADGAVLRVRFHGIDAPEYHFPAADGRIVGQFPFGKEANLTLREMVPVGSVVELLDFGIDKFGRTIGRVLFNGVDMNLEMVRQGMAVPYFYCVGADCDKTFMARSSVAEYVAACEKAQREGVGIFDPARPMREMPYEFRRRIDNRTSTSLTGDFKTKELFEAKDSAVVPVCQRVFFLNAKDAAGAGFFFSRNPSN